jgi:hypothetical protein
MRFVEAVVSNAAATEKWTSLGSSDTVDLR